MQIIIQSPHFTLSEELNNSINEKVGKLSHLHHKIEVANVCLKIEKSETTADKVCEIRLAIPGNDLFVNKHSETFEDALHQAVDALQEQIRKVKDKHTV